MPALLRSIRHFVGGRRSRSSSEVGYRPAIKMERLEERALLAVATLMDSDFKRIEGEIALIDESGAAQPNFSGGARVTVSATRVILDEFEGTHRESGWMEYTSQTRGTGEFSGQGTGSGIQRMTVDGSIVESTPYEFEYAGSGRVIDEGGNLQRVGQTVSGFDYTSSEAPPEGGGTPYSSETVSGTFDTRNFSIDVEWSLGWDPEGIMAEGNFNGILYPEPGDFDIVLDEANVDWVGDQITFSWSAPGPPQKTPAGEPSHTTPISQVQMYWSTTPELSGIVGDPLLPDRAIPIYWNQLNATYEIKNLPALPAGDQARYLLINAEAVAGEVTPKNNLVALPTGDVSIKQDSDGMEYLRAGAPEQDEILIQVESQKLEPTDRFGLSLYWTSDGMSEPNTIFNDLLTAPAYRIPPDQLKASLGSDWTGSVSVPIRSLTPPPDFPGRTYRWLVAHADSMNHENQAHLREGSIEEADEQNNFFRFDVRPDIKNLGGDWHPEGGFQVDVEVEHRAFLPQFAPQGRVSAEVFWSSNLEQRTQDGLAASHQVRATPDLAEILVPPEAFSTDRPPALSTQGVVVVVNSNPDLTQLVDERDQSNNTDLRLLTNTTPQVEVSIDPLGTFRPERKKQYLVNLTITNQAAYPLAFNYTFREYASAENPVEQNLGGIWHYRGCTDKYDATTCALRVPDQQAASWEDSQQNVLGSNESETTQLLVASRTWNWLPPLREDVDTNVLLIKELFGILTSAIAPKLAVSRIKDVLSQLNAPLGSAPGNVLGFFYGKATDAVASLGEEQLPDPQVFTNLGYDARVTTLAENGTTVVTEEKQVSVTVPQSLREAYHTVRRASLYAQSGYSAIQLLATSKTGAAAVLVAGSEQRKEFFNVAEDIPELFEVIVVNYRKALDPPDPEYFRHAPLPAEMPPETTDFWELRDWNQRRLTRSHQADVVILDRVLGAVVSQNPFWIAEQQLARAELLREFTMDTRIKLLHEHVLLPAYADIFSADQKPHTPAERLQQLRELLSSANIDSQTIELLLALDEELSADSATELSLELTRLDLASLATSSIRTLGEGIRQAVDAGILTTREVPEATLSELESRDQEIRRQLGEGIATRSLDEKIVKLIHRVHEVAFETANLETLQHFLQFGYGALFEFSLLATRPSQLVEWVDEQADEGALEASDAAQIRDRLDEITDHWRGASFEEGNAILRGLGATIQQRLEETPGHPTFLLLRDHLELWSSWGTSTTQSTLLYSLPVEQFRLAVGQSIAPFADGKLSAPPATLVGGGATVSVSAGDGEASYQFSLKDVAEVQVDEQTGRVAYQGQTVATLELQPSELKLSWLSALTEGSAERILSAIQIQRTTGTSDGDELHLQLSDGRGGVIHQTLIIRDPSSRVAGDSDGDGLFTSSDLVVVFQAGKYEDDVPNNASFEEGDWNGDGDFDSGDLVDVFQQGHYERPAPVAVALETLFLFAKSQLRDTREDHRETIDEKTLNALAQDLDILKIAKS